MSKAVIGATGAFAVLAVGIVGLNLGNEINADIDDKVKLAINDAFKQNGPQSTDCVGGIRYIAYEVEESKKNSRQMGPTLRLTSAEQGKQRFQEKINCDRLYAATIVYFLIDGENFNPQDAVRLAITFQDRNTWVDYVNMINESIDEYELSDKGATAYDTLGMILMGNRDIMPGLTKFGERPALGQVLTLKLVNGQKRDLRVECDLQPSVQNFKYVPAPPPVHEIPPPSVITTTSTPPTRTVCIRCTTTRSTPPPPPPPPPPPRCPDGTPPPCWTPPPPTTSKNPAADPGPQGNTGEGGMNENTGPGEYIPPQGMEPAPSTSWSPPPPPPVIAPPAATTTVVVPGPVDPGAVLTEDNPAVVDDNVVGAVDDSGE